MSITGPMEVLLMRDNLPVDTIRVDRTYDGEIRCARIEGITITNYTRVPSLASLRPTPIDVYRIRYPGYATRYLVAYYDRTEHS